MASFFAPDPSRPPRARRDRHLYIVPQRNAPNRWVALSLVCGLVFPVTLAVFAALFAFARGFRFPFFQGAVGLITIAPTGLALLTGLAGFAREHRLARVAERRTLHRLAIATLALACLDLLGTAVLVLWGIVTSTVATGGSPF
jgi:hypothetical protein